MWVLKIWSWGIYFSTAASMNALGSSWELSLMLCLTQGLTSLLSEFCSLLEHGFLGG